MRVGIAVHVVHVRESKGTALEEMSSAMESEFVRFAFSIVLSLRFGITSIDVVEQSSRLIPTEYKTFSDD